MTFFIATVKVAAPIAVTVIVSLATEPVAKTYVGVVVKLWAIVPPSLTPDLALPYSVVYPKLLKIRWFVSVDAQLRGLLTVFLKLLSLIITWCTGFCI